MSAPSGLEVKFHVGDVIRKLRLARKWRNGDLAKAANVHKDTITRIEDGDIGQADKLEAVCQALGYTVAECYAMVPTSSGLSPSEATLLAAFQRLNKPTQEWARETILRFAEMQHSRATGSHSE